MAFKSTYDSKRSSSRRSSSSYTGYSSSSSSESWEDTHGACRDCAYYRAIKDPAYNYIFNHPTSHYCTYRGTVVEGMMHEYDSCSGFKRR
jgi:hypothetical protein